MSKEFKNIERFEVMEEKFGIVIEGIYAKYEVYSDWCELIVTGEIHSSDGTNIKEDVQIVATAYSDDGKVLGTDDAICLADKFYVIAPLKICIHVTEIPKSIRVYPIKF